MSKTFRIRKGLDISLKGIPELKIGEECSPKTFSIRQIDFAGLTPKLKLKEGEKVKRGEIVFFDKYMPKVSFVSPVSGEVKSVIRGAKRKMLEIVIEADGTDDKVEFKLSDYDTSKPEVLKDLLLEAGIWPFVKKRPYGIIADPDENPRDIFISMFDSAPLASDFDFILKDKKAEINTALAALKTLTDGDVYLNFKKGSKLVDLIDNKESYKINFFSGPHPSGLVGVQINKISPINKGEVIWTVNGADLPVIGGFLSTGVYNPERIVAICGSEIKEPMYFKTSIGAEIGGYLQDKLHEEHVRVISGNVLTGMNISERRFLGFYDNQVSVIPEGDKYEMFGWALPGFNKLSMSSTFASMILPNKKFAPDTNIHGGKRAFVVTGQYEKVCPIDIYPQLLLKAILAEDIDKMEQMGIYEVIEEDLALCEFACTSKTDVQEILRKGLDLMIKELS
ncbi:MAG: NADH:ubiquinone reductase (Na(+)-transporting) subunit A [Marinilabiliales bacterium]|nr:MAG: NADH:ubiquinone reductase (Na(+)-transporting) subunit A [Marinilabiliales bacterium]